jgi:ATP sulfurylase
VDPLVQSPASIDLWLLVVLLGNAAAGCTHFIIGRDMAGCKSTLSGEDFYGAYDAQELAGKNAAELNMQTVPSLNIAYTQVRWRGGGG